jgi:FkbM family methyltransferase
MNYLKSLIRNALKKFNIKITLEEDYFYIDTQKLKKSFEEIDNTLKPINIEDLLGHFSKNYKDSKAQLMQDLFVDYILNKDNGLFVEVGACDGLVHSNSFFLEKNKNWNGILCEPAEFWHKELLINRPNCFIEKKPIFNSLKKKVNFSIKKGGRSHIDNNNNDKNLVSLDSITLNQLFSKQGINKIDYLSVDTEGSEFDILSDLNYTKYRPTIITVEHNYKKTIREKILQLLNNNNYSRVFKSISRFDDWFIDNEFKR